MFSKRKPPTPVTLGANKQTLNRTIFEKNEWFGWANETDKRLLTSASIGRVIRDDAIKTKKRYNKYVQEERNKDMQLRSVKTKENPKVS